VSELDEAIHLCAYEQQWPNLFADESRRIAVELPADIAIEHIGSTAVPGLLAKPIIDLMLGMAPRCSVDYVRSQLAALGYQDMGEAGVPGRIYFRRRASAAFNVALVIRDSSIWIANLALRDYLRANPDAAREYAEAKRSALNRGIRSLLAYSDYKSDVIARLISQAVGSR
jgi:GrpB-like predicted nucleotidyltransferase (UPF0157 family)